MVILFNMMGRGDTETGYIPIAQHYSKREGRKQVEQQISYRNRNQKRSKVQAP
jgi:hypothetical protein